MSLLRIALILSSLVVLLFPGECCGQDTIVTIRGMQFGISSIYPKPGDQNTVRVERLHSQQAPTLLNHLTIAGDGDCNSESWEIGNWDVKDTLIRFYSKWMKAGDAPGSPVGVRKQVYRVAADGRVVPLIALCWIQEGSMSPIAEETDWIWDRDDIDPLDSLDQAHLKRYEEWVLENYQAKLVSRSESKELIKEVNKALKDSIEGITSGWDKIEAYRNFGINK